MARRPILTAALTIALAGCAGVVPDQRADLAIPESFLLAPPTVAEQRDLRALLPTGDAGFVQLGEAAQANAPTIAAALARIDAARAGVRGTGAARLPNVIASGSVTGQRIGAAQTGSLPPGVVVDRESVLYQAGVQASYDFDLFGGLRASQRAATARLDAASADARAVSLALEADTARAVIEWRAVERRMMLAQSDLAQAEDFTAIVGERARVGLVADFDRVRAQSLATDARSRLAALAAERAALIGQFVSLTTLPSGDIVTILERTAPDTALAPVDGATPVNAIRARPDIAAAEARLRAADADIAAAAADRFPKLTLSSVIGVAALALGDLFDGDAVAGSIGGSLAGPLFDFGRIAARIDARQADARIAFADYRGTVFGALGEVEQAYGQVQAADARLAATIETAALNEDAVRLVEIRYRRGLDNITSVIDARRSAYAAQQTVALARAEAQAARVRLFRALGGASDQGS